MSDWRSSYNNSGHRDKFKQQKTSLFSNRQSAVESKPKKMSWDWSGLEDDDKAGRQTATKPFSHSGAHKRDISKGSVASSSSRNASSLKRPSDSDRGRLSGEPVKRLKTSQAASDNHTVWRKQESSSHGSARRSDIHSIADMKPAAMSPPPQRASSYLQGAARGVTDLISPPPQQRSPSVFSRTKPPTSETRSMLGRTATPGPFVMIDDSDGDSDDAKPPPPRSPSPQKQPTTPTQTSSNVRLTSQQIKLESQRKRLEALAKKQAQTSRPGSTSSSMLPPPTRRQESDVNNEHRRPLHVMTKAASSEVIDLENWQPTTSERLEQPSIRSAVPMQRTTNLPQEASKAAGKSEIPFKYDELQQKANLEAKLRESEESAKREELQRERELERRELANAQRKQQLEQERAKEAADRRQKAEMNRKKQLEAEAEVNARRAQEQRMQEELRRKHEADAKLEAERRAKAAVRKAERLAEEQKKAAEQRPKPSVLSEEQQRLKQERIRKQAERNKRLGDQNDAKEVVVEDDNPNLGQLSKSQPKSLAQMAREAHQAGPAIQIDDDGDLRPPTRNRLGPAIGPGPVSLRNAVDTNTASATHSEHSTRHTLARPIPSDAPKNHARLLGDIESHDAKLLIWRDTDGKRFEDMVQPYKDLTGFTRAGDTISKRYRYVKRALNAANVPWRLINELADGSEDAKAQINAMLPKEARVTLQQSHTPRPGDVKQNETRTAHGREIQERARDDSQTDKAKYSQVSTLAGNTTASGSFSSTLSSGTSPAWKANSRFLPPVITPFDAQLVRWKDSGAIWSEIIDSWRDATGTSSAEETLRSRYRALRNAFDTADIEDHLLNEMVRGVVGAEEEVNRRVFSPQTPPTPPARRDSPIEESNSFPGSSLPKHIGSIADAYAGHESIERPTTGGKTIDSKFMENMMWNMNQVYEERMAEADEPSDNESEIDAENPEDYVYYTYVVHRRERVNFDPWGSDSDSDSSDSEEDEDEDEDEDPQWSEWEPVSKPYENLAKANAAVVRELGKVRPNRILDPRYMKLSTKADENGLLHGRLVNSKVGKVHVVIRRYKHQYDDNKRLPQSKEGWISKICYKIMERQVITEKSTTTTTKEKEDDLFGDGEEEETVTFITEKVHDKERQLPDLTTSLEQANDLAAVYFAKVTIDQGPNLSVTDKLRKEKAESIMPVEDEELFYRKEADDDGNTVEVWVERATLKGPRNI